MTVAQGIDKITSYKKQTALGSAASGSGGQKLRRRTSVFTATRATFESDEIASHQQSTGIGYGLKQAGGKLAGLLSAGTYAAFIGSALRADFAAVSAYSAGSDVTAQVAAPQFADASGGFLTAGLKVGMVGRWTGFAGSPGSGNNSRNFLITALTATDMSGIFLDGGTAYADAAGDAVTFTPVGKFSKAPLTGHTNDYYTIEEWYSNISRSETFTDVQVGNLAFGLPATGNATLDIDMVGLGRTLGASQVLTTPTAETTTDVLTAVNGAVLVNGTQVSNVTGAQLTINPNVRAGEAVVGSNTSTDIQRGRIAVSGQFTAMFDAVTLQTAFDAETPISLILVLTANDTATSDFVAITLGKVKLTGDAPDDGEKQIVRTYPFTAEINSSGGAALAWDKTIITIQDSAA